MKEKLELYLSSWIAFAIGTSLAIAGLSLAAKFPSPLISSGHVDWRLLRYQLNAWSLAWLVCYDAGVVLLAGWVGCRFAPRAESICGLPFRLRSSLFPSERPGEPSLRQ